MALAYVLITIESGQEVAVFAALRGRAHVTEVMPLFGEYDLIAKVEGKDIDEIGSTILQSIRTIPGVLATKTLAGTRF